LLSHVMDFYTFIANCELNYTAKPTALLTANSQSPRAIALRKQRELAVLLFAVHVS